MFVVRPQVVVPAGQSIRYPGKMTPSWTGLPPAYFLSARGLRHRTVEQRRTTQRAISQVRYPISHLRNRFPSGRFVPFRNLEMEFNGDGSLAAYM